MKVLLLLSYVIISNLFSFAIAQAIVEVLFILNFFFFAGFQNCPK